VSKILIAMASQKSRLFVLTLLAVFFVAAAAYLLLVLSPNKEVRADVKAREDVKSFLHNSQPCAKAYANEEVLRKIRALSDRNRKLIQISNMLPKRIDYFVVDASSKQIVASVIYHPDRGCSGIYTIEPDFTSLN
jgi:hypothetical protein